jgi:hypothetical protein
MPPVSFSFNNKKKKIIFTTMQPPENLRSHTVPSSFCLWNCVIIEPKNQWITYKKYRWISNICFVFQEIMALVIWHEKSVNIYIYIFFSILQGFLTHMQNHFCTMKNEFCSCICIHSGLSSNALTFV